MFTLQTVNSGLIPGTQLVLQVSPEMTPEYHREWPKPTGVGGLTDRSKQSKHFYCTVMIVVFDNYA